jgi:chromosomal replication initiator protein
MVWSAIKSTLLTSLPENEYKLWINPLECKEDSEHKLKLVAPDRFFSAFVEKRYVDQIQKIASSMGLQSLDVQVQVSNAPLLETNVPSVQLRIPGAPVKKSRYRSLHPAFTFEQFMVGNSNMLAKSACSAIANNDRTYGHCLFMNSSTGLGKSHLTQAVVHEVMNTAPATNIQYLTAQQFAAEMVHNIRSNSMESFSKKFIQDCDVLLVEDVHTLIGKNKTQEELNTILDYLIKTGRRVVFTSAVTASNLKGLDEDFRSRMTSGLVAGISTPDYTTRMRIVRHKAGVSRLTLSEEVADHLARGVKDDVRKIESAVLGLKAKSAILNQEPDLAMAKAVLDELVCNAGNICGESIRDFISDQFRVSPDDLQSRSRKRAIAYPRQIGMYLTRKMTKESLADIGSIYNRDHSTVLHAIKVITRDMAQEEATRKQVELLCSKLKN